MAKILSILAALFGAVMYLLGRGSAKQSEQESKQAVVSKQIQETVSVHSDIAAKSDSDVDAGLHKYLRD